jgi:hypothetical protein
MTAAENGLFDAAVRKALGIAVAALEGAAQEEEGKKNFALYEAIRKGTASLQLFDEPDAVDHLINMAIDVQCLPAEMVQHAVMWGMRDAEEAKGKQEATRTNGSAPHHSPLGVIDAGDDAGPVTPRRWLLGNQFCRRFLSSVFAPGGTGKSALRMLQCLALATGRPLTSHHVFHRCRVLIISLEDDIDELRRRIAAACIHHHIPRTELKGWMFYAAPKGMKLAEMVKGSRQIGKMEQILKQAIQLHQPDLISLDPFVKLHALEENDNGAMDFVADLLTKLAIEFDIAVDAPHHTRKGTLTAGDPDVGRGASGIRDAGRLVFTLTAMADDEAETFGIPADERAAYVRLDSAKVNIAPKATAATWFRMVGVQLGNGTAEYPAGDTVQTLEPWTPPGTWGDLSTDQLNAALTQIDAGMPSGQKFSDANRATERAAWPVVQEHCPGKTEAQCREIIRTWVKTGVLIRKDYNDPVTRETRQGLCLNPLKRPGTTL